ncbi:MAG: hypothetical protein NTX35_02535 [Verrucomicrobia bacterium]|jgi:hypothetical protein|nr:hypothetical protein [Verrucomicrobiota bacterium]
MKTSFWLSVAAMVWLVSCETPSAQDSSAYYDPSANHLPVPREVVSSRSTANNTPLPRGGYAPGSGLIAVPPTDQFMHQQNESGLFGSRSRSTVIQSSGGVQSYQTIGGVPVYPGASVPGYLPNQPYFGAPTSQQPVYVPGVGGNPGYHLNPSTGARVRP